MNCSRDMFEDSLSNTSSIEVETEDDSRGVPLSEIKARRKEKRFPVRPGTYHQVLFKVPIGFGPPFPYPDVPSDAWDANHVRMPHSPQSLYPLSQTELSSRWELIKEALRKPIQNSKELEAAIFTYNLRSSQSLNALHQFFSETITPEESDYFFEKILPGIINLALEIQSSIRTGVRLLKEHRSSSLSLSQEQVAILLANAFLCTFPRRPLPAKYPTINFLRLFQCSSVDSVQEKLKCFVNYFRRICNKRPTGVITYSRQYMEPNALPDWADLEVQLPSMHITNRGTIEAEGAGLLEVDFANKLVGGGVLGRGSVQEEIKFLICPELVAARLFTEALDDTEALVVIGCETYNSYEGYASSFTWAGNVNDSSERDKWGRLETAVVAIDAVYFSDPRTQFQPQIILRELNKAYTGFSAGRGGGIATGNWGCGAFRGDPRLKALIQLMAAAAADVSLAYFTFGDTKLRDDVYEMWKFLTDNNISVGQLWAGLITYCNKHTHVSLPLYDYLLSTVSSSSRAPKKTRSQEKGLTQEQEKSEEIYGTSCFPSECSKHSKEPKTGCIDGSGNCRKESNSVCNNQKSPKKFSNYICQKTELNAEVSKKVPHTESSESNESKNVRQDSINKVSRDNRISKVAKEEKHDVDDCGEGRKIDKGEGQSRREPLQGKTFSLETPEDRAQCLASEKVRWDDYRTAISKYSKSRPPKRKISDYFQKVDK